MISKKFVLSSDSSILSHYRNNLLFGYFAGVPVGKLSPFLYEKFNSAKMEQIPPKQLKSIIKGLIMKNS